MTNYSVCFKKLEKLIVVIVIQNHVMYIHNHQSFDFPLLPDKKKEFGKKHSKKWGSSI